MFPWTKKAELKMPVFVNRSSVCMGDDRVSHEKTYYMSDSATYKDLFRALRQDHYFPDVSGNNGVWVMTDRRHFCICSWFTKTRRFVEGLMETSLKKLCGEIPRVYLKYYPSPQKWKEQIEQEYGGNFYCMWRDGWDKEIAYCDKLMGADAGAAKFP